MVTRTLSTSCSSGERMLPQLNKSDADLILNQKTMALLRLVQVLQKIGITISDDEELDDAEENQD